MDWKIHRYVRILVKNLARLLHILDAQKVENDLFHKEVDNMKRIRNQKGFTLIELMIVIVIIGILAAIAIPRFATVRDDAEEASCKQNMNSLATAEEMHYADTSAYTAAASDLNTYVLNASSMECPTAGSGYSLGVAGANYTVTCPNSTSHGYIASGVASW